MSENKGCGCFAPVSGGFLVFILIAAALFIFFQQLPEWTKKPEPPPMPAFVGPPDPKKIAAEKKQAEARKKAYEAQVAAEAKEKAQNQKVAAENLRTALRMGVFHKIVPGLEIEAYTGPRFDTLDIDQREAFLDAVAHHYNRYSVTLKDGRTGKTLGEYRRGSRGLRMK